MIAGVEVREAMVARAHGLAPPVGLGRPHVILLVAIALCTIGCERAPGARPARSEMRWGNGPGSWAPAPVEAAVLKAPPGQRDLWLRFTPPPLATRAPAMSFSLLLGLVEIRQGDAALFDPRNGWPLASLTDATTPVEMRLRLRHPRALLFPPLFGDALELSRWQVSSNLGQFAVGSTFAICGFVLLLTTLRRRPALEYPLLGLFLAPVGVVILGQARPLNLMLVSSLEAWRWAHDGCMFVYGIGLSLLFNHLFGDSKDRWLRWITAALVASLVAACGLDVFGLVPLFTSRGAAVVLGLASVARAVWVVFPRARRGDAQARIFLAGIVLLTLVALPDLLYGFNIYITEGQTGHFALLVFAVALAVVIERRARDHERGLARASKQIAKKYEELEARNAQVQELNEELKRQITQRSRELADILRDTQVRTADLDEGDVVDGRYRVVRRIGQGGMGAVFEVERAGDGRRFALKVMTGASTLAGRFAREAEIAAQVVHPNLVRVVDVGMSEGVLYLVMELVVGASLEACHHRFGDLPWAVRVLRQTADGLVALHERGVVHRDLKPANVLVTELANGSPHARITDFGISRIVDSVDPVAATMAGRARSATLTATGLVVGTPLYMAPELAHGARGARSSADLFSFGVMAFELITGELPFRVPPAFEALAGKPVTRAPSLAARSLPLEPELLAAIDSTIDPDPAARPSAEAMARLLAASEALSRGEPTAERESDVSLSTR
jgi:hypothetical protein